MIHEGMRRYGIVAVVFLSTAVSVGTAQYAFGLFIPPLVEEFGWSKTAIGASLSFAAVGGLTAPVVGRAMDRFGARFVLLWRSRKPQLRERYKVLDLQLRQAPWATLIHEDEHATVFELSR